MTSNATGKKYKGKVRTALFAFMSLNIILFIILMFFTRSFWKEVNAFMQDATGASWDWVTIIITVSILLVINYAVKTTLCVKKMIATGDASPGILQIFLMVPVFLAWNGLGITLVQEAADAVIAAQTSYYSGLVLPFLSLLLCGGAVYRAKIKKDAGIGRFALPALLALVFLGFSVSGFINLLMDKSHKIVPQDGEIFNAQILFDSETDPEYITFRIPGIVITPKGTIVVYCEARESYDDWGDIDLVMKRSLDGGSTWEKRRRLFSSGSDTVNNPVMVSENDSETIHLLYFTNYNKSFYQRSDDAGETWSNTIDTTASFEGFKKDFPWKTIAAGPGHGIQLKSGRILIPVWLSLGQGSDGHHPSVVSAFYSDDRGDTWQTGDIVPHADVKDPSEPVTVELSDGRAMINMRNNEYSKDYAYRAVSISPDGATGWTESYLDTSLPDPVCFGSLHRYDENTILFSNCQYKLATSFSLLFFNLWGPREPLGIKVSFDDGKTWPISRVYQKDEAGYSDINVKNGIIYALYEQGWRKKNKYRTRYLKLVRFNLEWIKNSTKKN